MRMTRSEKSWILYDWANSAYSIVITTAILPIYFKNVAAENLPGFLSTAYWGYGNTLYTIILFLMAPVLGTIADYQLYKKRFFIGFLGLAIVSTLSLVMIGPGDWEWCIALYILSALGFSGSNIFYDAFLVDVTSKKRVDWISSVGFALGYIGSTIPFILSILVIMKPGLLGLDSKSSGVRASFLITAIWWALFSIPILLNVRQRHYIPLSSRIIGDSVARLINTIREIRRYRHVFLFLLAYFLYIDGVDTIIKMAGIYGIDVGVSENELMMVLLAVQVVAAPFALLYGRLAERFSAKRMLLAGIAIYILTTVWAYFIHSVWEFWVLGMLVASSQGGIQALSRSLFSRIIPHTKSAEFFGFYNMFGKLAAVMGPFLVGITSQITHNSRLGILSLILLFAAGGTLLLRIHEPHSSGNSGTSPSYPNP